MDKLNKVKKDLNLPVMWCGPTVIAGMTGEKLSTVYAAIRKALPQVQSNEAIKGMNWWVVRATLDVLGWQIVKRDEFYPKDSQPTLAEYASKNRAKFQRHAMLVNVTGHWTSLYGRRGLDNHCNDYSPVPLRKLHFRRSRVKTTWSVLPKDEALQPDPVMPVFVPPKSGLIAARKKLQKARVALAGNVKDANKISVRLAAKLDVSAVDMTDVLDSINKGIQEAEKNVR